MTPRMLWDNFITYNLQIGLLVGLAAFVPAALRLHVARARLAFWQILLAACLLLPLFAPMKREVISISIQTPATITVPAGSAAPVKHSIPRSEIALGLFAAGVAARLIWLCAGFWRLRQYRRRSLPLVPPPSWSVEADLRLSADVSSPVTFGFRRPVVLLPANFEDLDGHMQDAILCHEIMHVRRRDWLFTLAEETLRCVFWFHPAVWWLLGEIGLAREQAVDREVIELTKSRDGYLDALLAIAGATPRLDLAPAPLFLRRRHLKQRVISILKEVRMSKTKRISAFAAGLCLLAASCWFVAATLPLSAAPQMVADGPGVTVDLGGANILHRTGVMYPPAALKANVQGVVTVEATVDSAGNVVDAKVLSGPAELRRAALQSVLQWHFAMDSSLNTRRVSINFTPPPQSSAPGTGVLAGIVSGVPSGSAPPPPPRKGSLDPARDAAIASMPRTVNPTNLAGHTLARIVVNGLSDQATKDLLSRLPVREGDVLQDDSFERVANAVHDYDEHLTVGRTSTGNEATIVIMAPGANLGGVVGGVVTASPAAAFAPPAPGGPKRITIGGNVQQAKLISQPRPVYPPLAKQARIQGVVRLAALIGADGTIKELQVISGHPLLVPAATDAVQQWVYQKTLLNGEPVEVITEIDVNFTLSDQPPQQ
jgi:TonB family protein